jgi:hypothetical protein
MICNASALMHAACVRAWRAGPDLPPCRRPAGRPAAAASYLATCPRSRRAAACG